MRQDAKAVPESLEGLVLYRYPDALDIDYQQVGRETYLIHVYDQDYSYNRWLACLSLDNRWTLSPVYVK